MYLRIVITLCILALPHISYAAQVRVNLLDSTFWEQANVEGLEYAIENGHKVNVKDNFGSTPLFLAVLNNGNPDLIHTLIKHGAEVDPISLENTTPLLEAARFCNFPAIEALIQHGANVNVKDNANNTPLMLASVYNKDPRIVEILIKNGADIQAINYEGETALIRACQESNFPEMIDALLRNGADPNDTTISGFNPFMRACRFNKHPQVIDVFLQNKANVRARFNGNTALDYAKDNPHIFESEAYWRLHEATPKHFIDTKL